MNDSLRSYLLAAVRERLTNDPSHDLGHTLRVLHLAEQIARAEGGDLEIVGPAALLHDVIVHEKDDPRSAQATDECAALAELLLTARADYPRAKIPVVVTAVRQCSYSKGIVAESREGKILQDADRLEATGAIAILRTFASSGRMSRPFFHSEDPFCERREPNPRAYAVDLFHARLLRVEAGMHTAMGRTLARRRTEFLHTFLEELRRELEESGAVASGAR